MTGDARSVEAAKLWVRFEDLTVEDIAAAPSGTPYAMSRERALSRLVREAVAAERERCARVAERLAWTHVNSAELGPELNCVKVAAAIRSLGDPHE